MKTNERQNLNERKCHCHDTILAKSNVNTLWMENHYNCECVNGIGSFSILIKNICIIQLSTKIINRIPCMHCVPFTQIDRRTFTRNAVYLFLGQFWSINFISLQVEHTLICQKIRARLEKKMLRSSFTRKQLNCRKKREFSRNVLRTLRFISTNHKQIFMFL